MNYGIRVGYLEMFGIETEENLQCGFTTTGGAKGGNAVSDKKVNEVKKVEPMGSHDDLPEYRNDFTATNQKLQRLTGMSEPEAKESMQAILNYTELGSTDIRSFQYGNTKTMSPEELKTVRREVKVINKYIDKMPKFKGEIYRGKDFENSEKAEAFLKKLKETSDYKLPAMSSFSSTPKIADSFALDRSKMGIKGRVPMVFAVENKSGVSIRSLSVKTREDEVLVPKNVRYGLKGEPYKKDGIWYVPLVEK